MSAQQAPPSVLSLLTTGQAARVLGLNERTVRSWVEGGTLPASQPRGPRGRRYIHSDELARFAQAHRWPLDWEAAL